jgi:uncharacterized protein
MKKLAVLVAIVAICVVFALGLIIGTRLTGSSGQTPATEGVAITNFSSEKEVNMNLPAVDANMNGVVAKLTTKVRPGEGGVLVKINDVFPGLRMQNSALVAAMVASNYTRINLSSLDIIFSIKADATVVEGPSAGAAMAVSAVSALEGRTPDPNVMITGEVREDGSILPIGGVTEKARAAKENNATLFLVPPNQKLTFNTYGGEKNCKTSDGATYCSIDYVQKEMNISGIVGIRVEEVRNIAEAMRYFYEK